MQDTKSGKDIEPSKYKTLPTFGPRTLADEVAELHRLRGRGWYDNHDDLDYEDDDE